ncbi:hypothetical protein ES703_80563 [subsurface metagenome]
MPEKDKRAKVGLVIGAGLLAAAVSLAIYGLAYGAEAPLPPESIFLSNMMIEPAQVFVGEPVSISVIITNMSEEAGTYNVICEVA